MNSELSEAVVLVLKEVSKRLLERARDGQGKRNKQ